MIYFLFLTAFTVSIDSLVCGFSLSFKGGKKIMVVPIITATVFAMCLTVNFFSSFFSDFLDESASIIGGIILICVGIFNLVPKKERSNKSKNLYLQSFITGLAVGIDGAIANLSLAIMGINQFYVPLVIALMHALMISIGIVISNRKVSKFFYKYNFLPPIVLILLGIIKIMELVV